jgi:hypothetical protein
MLTITSAKIAQLEPIGISIDQIRQSITAGEFVDLKYVRVGDEYRFCDISDHYGCNHKRLLREGEVPTGAAFLHIRPDGLFIDSYSTTLNIGSAAGDQENFCKMFNLPPKERW